MAVSAALGGAVRRREDPRLVTGAGQYTDDVRRDGCLHAVFVRSTFAHARITNFDAAAALEPGATVIHPGRGDNLAFAGELGEEGALDGADVIIRGRFLNQRLAGVPIEASAVLAEPDDEGGIRIWASTQVPFSVRMDVASATGLPESKVRVIAPDVGGGFGAKLMTYPEQSVLGALALK